ncbi:MAG: 50S ribosomal protein L19e [Nanoarchaeota archaeon]|nr:50S ribosomal protein L19e [Nanoarchaeota archaeon]
MANKKILAGKVLGVGKGRIIFSNSHLSEIKEAITRRDIVDLYKSGAIQIKEIKGRRKITKRKNKRRTGKIKKKVNRSKQEYVIITRKLRSHLKHLLKTNLINKENYKNARKQIRARKFKSKRHLKESMEEL